MPIYLQSPPEPPYVQCWDGTTYKKSSWAQFTLAYELLKSYPFKGDENILDIGCGNGKISALIAEEKVPNGSVFGLDISNSMIATAKEDFSSIPNLQFQQGDAQKFHLDQSFDLIVSFTALHWAPDQEAVWKNIFDHLKPQGRVLVSLNPPPRLPAFTDTMHYMQINDHWNSYLKDFKENPFMPEYSIEQYIEIILKSGLQVHRAEYIWDHFTFNNRQAMEEGFLGWLPQLKMIPQESKEAFVEEFTAKFLQETEQDPRGPVTLYFNRFIIEADRE